MTAERSGQLQLDRLLDLLTELALVCNGRDLARMEQIISGPISGSTARWVVLLYRNTAVQQGRQLIGRGYRFDEPDQQERDYEDVNERAWDWWSSAIVEPPGSELADENVDPNGIAWCGNRSGWSAETGPPGSGLPATRIARFDQLPERPITVVFNVLQAAVRSVRSSNLTAIGIAAGRSYAGARFVSDVPIDRDLAAAIDAAEGRARAALEPHVLTDFGHIHLPGRPRKDSIENPPEWDALPPIDVQWRHLFYSSDL